MNVNQGPHPVRDIYSKNLNNRQTLGGFVDNYELIYKVLHPQGRAAPLWGTAEGRACVFFIFPSVFEVFCRLSHNYQQTLPGFVYY